MRRDNPTQRQRPGGEGAPPRIACVHSECYAGSSHTLDFGGWHSTEAPASSSTRNCGCEPSWASSPAGDPGATQGIGCVTGGGNFTSEPFPCTNYWAPTDLDSSHRPSDKRCAITDEATLGGCVSNLTAKIPGDDTSHIMDVFEDFLARKAPGGAEAAPFLAVRCPELPTCATASEPQTCATASDTGP